MNERTVDTIHRRDRVISATALPDLVPNDVLADRYAGNARRLLRL